VPQLSHFHLHRTCARYHVTRCFGAKVMGDSGRQCCWDLAGRPAQDSVVGSVCGPASALEKVTTHLLVCVEVGSPVDLQSLRLLRQQQCASRLLAWTMPPRSWRRQSRRWGLRRLHPWSRRLRRCCRHRTIQSGTFARLAPTAVLTATAWRWCPPDVRASLSP